MNTNLKNTFKNHPFTESVRSTYTHTTNKHRIVIRKRTQWTHMSCGVLVFWICVKGFVFAAHFQYRLVLLSKRFGAAEVNASNGQNQKHEVNHTGYVAIRHCLCSWHTEWENKHNTNNTSKPMQNNETTTQKEECVHACVCVHKQQTMHWTTTYRTSLRLSNINHLRTAINHTTNRKLHTQTTKWTHARANTTHNERRDSRVVCNQLTKKISAKNENMEQLMPHVCSLHILAKRWLETLEVQKTNLQQYLNNLSDLTECTAHLRQSYTINFAQTDAKANDVIRNSPDTRPWKSANRTYRISEKVNKSQPQAEVEEIENSNSTRDPVIFQSWYLVFGDGITVHCISCSF